MFLLKLLFSPDATEDKPWHHESVEYHKRINRHRDSLDPNYFQLNHHVSSTGNVVEHDCAPEPTIRERRNASIVDSSHDSIGSGTWDRAAKSSRL